MVPSGSHMFLPTICWKFLHPRLQHHVSGFLHVSVILGNSKQLWGVRDHLIDLIRHLPCLARAAAHGEAVAQLWIWWWRKLTEDKLMKLEDVRSLRWLNFLRTDWGAERFMAGWMFGCIEMFGCLVVNLVDVLWRNLRFFSSFTCSGSSRSSSKVSKVT